LSGKKNRWVTCTTLELAWMFPGGSVELESLIKAT
jgi:hypothetical protein